MKIAIYGKITRTTDFGALKLFFLFLQNHSIRWKINASYAAELLALADFTNDPLIKANIYNELPEILDYNFIYTIGGDGTILDAVRFSANSNIPLLGVNVGRLGFLASVSQFELIEVTQDLLVNNWKVENRTLLTIDTSPEKLHEMGNIGLNEITIHKANSNEMIVIHTYINGEFLNSYWADGLIISTPTGSTAYSLACGGPIIIPQAETLCLTPIAPHSLTVRPLIIPDSSVISFEIESRSGKVLVAIDNRTALTEANIEIAVRKADYTAKLVKVSGRGYFQTLRNRLSWGFDTRN